MVNKDIMEKWTEIAFASLAAQRENLFQTNCFASLR
jgi:hypothetical protein